MAKSFNDLAYDLRDFIVDKHANYRGLKHMSMQRYNNLTISMNSRRYGQPHVIVKIGISEGVFSFPYVLIKWTAALEWTNVTLCNGLAMIWLFNP